RMKTAEVIREIQQYQSVPYFLNPVQEIQIFIKSHLQDSRDVNELYEQSLAMEPREREDEKIARLLQESG
ncbi:2555_t:CDS:1, partial [Ambispora leptoticha]